MITTMVSYSIALIDAPLHDSRIASAAIARHIASSSA